MPNGSDFLFLLDTIRAVFRTLLNLIRQVFVFLLRLIRNAFIFIVRHLVVVVRFLVRSFGALARFLRHLWRDVIRPALAKLVGRLADLWAWLDEHARRILRILRRIRELYDQWFNRIFGPILRLITRLRRILAVFRVFNVKWAKKLDARLLRLEGKIFEAVHTIRRQLNLIATHINLVLDADDLIRAGPLGRSLRRALGAIGAVLGLFDEADIRREEVDARKRALSFPQVPGLADEIRRVHEMNLPELARHG